MQNYLRTWFFYFKLIYYNHQQPSLVGKYDFTFVCARR